MNLHGPCQEADHSGVRVGINTVGRFPYGQFIPRVGKADTVCRTDRRAFTLIELLVVIAIIAMTTSSSISVKARRSVRHTVSAFPTREMNCP